jgi:chloramphenicol-sensitive protein RarD
MRKIAHVSPLVGVAVETAMLLPIAIVYAIVSPSAHPRDAHDLALLAISGLVTGLPLLWFTAAARRLRLTTLGFLQYLAPVGQFLLAVFAYHEPFGRWNLIGFSFIWAALVVYSIDSYRAYRASSVVAAPEPDDDERVPAIAEV